MKDDSQVSGSNTGLMESYGSGFKLCLVDSFGWTLGDFLEPLQRPEKGGREELQPEKICVSLFVFGFLVLV